MGHWLPVIGNDEYSAMGSRRQGIALGARSASHDAIRIREGRQRRLGAASAGGEAAEEVLDRAQQSACAVREAHLHEEESHVLDLRSSPYAATGEP
jgi:hypothetical protein